MLHLPAKGSWATLMFSKDWKISCSEQSTEDGSSSVHRREWVILWKFLWRYVFSIAHFLSKCERTQKLHSPFWQKFYIPEAAVKLGVLGYAFKWFQGMPDVNYTLVLSEAGSVRLSLLSGPSISFIRRLTVYNYLGNLVALAGTGDIFILDISALRYRRWLWWTHWRFFIWLPDIVRGSCNTFLKNPRRALRFEANQ